MIGFLTVIHVIVSFFLILVVLLQQGKGQDIGSAFGGAGTQATFGARGGATLLTKLTTVAAVMFMLTSLTLTIMISRPGVNSVIDEDALATPAIPLEEPLLGGDVELTPEGVDGLLAPADQAAPEN